MPHELNLFDRRRRAIALDTVRNPAKALLGGPTVDEAKQTLRRFGYKEQQIINLEADR